MNSFLQILAPRAFSLIFAASMGSLAACSTGTNPGDTNVEDGSAKDKNPDKRDQPGQNTSNMDQTVQDTSRAYERSRQTPHNEQYESHEGHDHN